MNEKKPAPIVRSIVNTIFSLALIYGVYKGTGNIYLALAASCAVAIYRIGPDNNR